MSGIHLHKISCLAPLIPVMASDHFFPHRRFSHFIKDLLSDKNNNVLSPLRSSVETKDKVERGRYQDLDWSSHRQLWIVGKMILKVGTFSKR